MASTSADKKCWCDDILCEAVEKDDINFVRKALEDKDVTYEPCEVSHLFEKMVSREMVSLFFQHFGDEILKYYAKQHRSIFGDVIEFNKNIEIVEEIILFRKDIVNSMDIWDRTPLFYCVSDPPNAELVKCLLLNGAQVNTCGRFRISPLHYASDLDIVNILIEAGADVNAKDVMDMTPLMKALCRRRCKEVIFKLIEYGADLNAPDEMGRIPLHYAFMSGYEEDVIYKIFGKTANVNARQKSGNTPLRDAFGHFVSLPYQAHAPLYRKEFIFDLVNKGAEIDFRVFTYAIRRHENSEIVKAFIDYGFDIRSVDSYGNSVLHYSEDSKLVNLLVRNGASLNLKNNNGETPLMMAILNINIPLVKSLLLHGSNPDDGLDFYLKYVDADVLFFKEDFFSVFILHGANFSLENEKCKKLFVQVFKNEIKVDDYFKNSLILKYVFISNENVTDLDLPGIHEISKIYKPELDKMKSVNITRNVSVYDFCMKHYKSTQCSISTSDSMLLKNDNIESLFPIFHNEIKIKMKISRTILLSKLFKLSIRSSRNSNVPGDNDEIQKNDVDGGVPSDYVELFGDNLYHLIGCYLNDVDVKCLLYAAINK